ncbi:MAG: T9SS type A sorting domain-containing protein [Chitinophagales bacterium]
MLAIKNTHIALILFLTILSLYTNAQSLNPDNYSLMETRANGDVFITDDGGVTRRQVFKNYISPTNYTLIETRNNGTQYTTNDGGVTRIPLLKKQDALPVFDGTPIQWLSLMRNETASTHPDDIGSIPADIIFLRTSLILEEEIILVYELESREGWLLTSIDKKTGGTNWTTVRSRPTNNAEFRTSPIYLYKSSESTIELIGYEHSLGPIAAIFGDIGYMFKASISLIDGAVVSYINPKEEDGGTFVFNSQGINAKLLHFPEQNKFLITEFFPNNALTPIGIWKTLEANGDCKISGEEKYLTATNDSINRYLYQIKGLGRTGIDGAMLFLQEWNAENFVNPVHHIELAKLDSDRSLVWKKDITSDVGINGRFVSHSSNTYLVYGKLYTGSIPFDDNAPYYASNFDDEGELLWKQTFPTTDELQTAVEYNEDTYLLAGVREESECFLVKLDKEGNTDEIANWQLNVGENYQKVIVDKLIPLQNGDIAISMFVYRDTTITNQFGETLTNRIGKRFIGLIDKDDLITDIPTENVIENTHLNMKVYPNPSNDFLNVYFQVAHQGILQLHNLHGQVIQQIQVDNEVSLKLDTSQLPKGLYYLQWNSEKYGQQTEAIVLK